jgi:hypothetical protein
MWSGGFIDQLQFLCSKSFQRQNEIFQATKKASRDL